MHYNNPNTNTPPWADPVCDQGEHVLTLKLKKKKNLVGIYKFKNYGFAKVLTLIFVLEKKIKGDKSIKITANNLNNPKL